MKELTVRQAGQLASALLRVAKTLDQIQFVREVLEVNDEDLAVAEARLHNWIDENEGRWVA